MENLIKRWKSRMPLFWHRVHRISLWLAGLSLAGGVTDMIFNLPDEFLLYPEYVRIIGKTIFTASTVGAVLSKLTRDENAEDKPKPEAKP